MIWEFFRWLARGSKSLPPPESELLRRGICSPALIIRLSPYAPKRLFVAAEIGSHSVAQFLQRSECSFSEFMPSFEGLAIWSHRFTRGNEKAGVAKFGALEYDVRTDQADVGANAFNLVIHRPRVFRYALMSTRFVRVLLLSE